MYTEKMFEVIKQFHDGAIEEIEMINFIQRLFQCAFIEKGTMLSENAIEYVVTGFEYRAHIRFNGNVWEVTEVSMRMLFHYHV